MKGVKNTGHHLDSNLSLDRRMTMKRANVHKQFTISDLKYLKLYSPFHYMVLFLIETVLDHVV